MGVHDNRYTRLLTQCCDHTKPVTAPCDDCYAKIVNQLWESWRVDYVQAASAQFDNLREELDRATNELAIVRAQRDSTDRKLIDRQKAVDLLQAKNAQLETMISDQSARYDAEKLMGIHETERKQRTIKK